jgi:hypothetical protein
MVVFGIGSNRMGGARWMSDGARGHRRHVEGGHQLLEGPILRADYAEDRSTLSRQGVEGVPPITSVGRNGLVEEAV